MDNIRQLFQPRPGVITIINDPNFPGPVIIIRDKAFICREFSLLVHLRGDQVLKWSPAYYRTELNLDEAGYAHLATHLLENAWEVDLSRVLASGSQPSSEHQPPV